MKKRSDILYYLFVFLISVLLLLIAINIFLGMAALFLA